MSTRRRRSLFENNDNHVSYRDKLREEVEQYLTILEDEKNKKIVMEHVKLSQDEILAIKNSSPPLPDLNEFTKTTEEFLKKDAILRQQREQLMDKAENLLFKIL